MLLVVGFSSRKSKPVKKFIFGCVVLLSLACAGVNHQPILDPVANQTIHVGETLELFLTARDSDGDSLSLTATPMPTTATISKVDGGFLFRWAPLINDTSSAGLTHSIRFRLSDGNGGVSNRWVDIVVLPQNSTPVFMGPSGYVFNLSQNDDISFRVAVKDDDSSYINFRLIEPIQGASLQRQDSKTMVFYWKPSADQIASGNYWQLAVGAKDETHDEIVRKISILFMNSDAAKDCPGTPPYIGHEPPNTVEGSTVVFRADADDANSEVREVILHFTTNNPLNPASYENNQLVLTRCNPNTDSGCPSDSNSTITPWYLGTLPSPAMTSSVPLLLHYYITAVDNDDIASTGCDQQSRFPKSGHFTIVTYPVGWSGGCKDDPMEPNNSVSTAPLIPEGLTLDLRSCPTDNSDDYYELAIGPETTVTASILHEQAHGKLNLSLHDSSGTQLYPPSDAELSESLSYTVTEGPAFLRVSIPPNTFNQEQTYGLFVHTSKAGCPSDSLEPNDSIAMAPFIGTGDYTLTVCPGDQEWLKVSANEGETLILNLSFQHQYGDLDIRLYDATQTLVGQSDTATSEENILYNAKKTGVFYVQVYGYQGSHNTGKLNIQRVPTNSLCVPDMFSPNQVLSSAMLLPEDVYLDLSICPGKDDWFRLDVNSGERVNIAVAPSYQSDLQLEIQMFQDGEGKYPLGTTTSEDGLIQIESPSLKEGPVWWRVFTPGNVTFNYDMGFYVLDPPGFCQDDRFSPTTTPSSALELSNEIGFVTRLKICPGGEDWFKINGEAFNELYVYVYGFSDEAPLTARLVQIDDNMQSIVVEGESTSNGVELLYLPEENREYYIHVMGAPGAAHHYDLVIGID